MKREDIDSIIIHCSATRAGQDLRAKDIDRMHRARADRSPLMQHIVTQRDFPVNRITSTRSAFVMLADWMQMESPQTLALRLKRLVCGN